MFFVGLFSHWPLFLPRDCGATVIFFFDVWLYSPVQKPSSKICFFGFLRSGTSESSLPKKKSKCQDSPTSF